jgi:hypothetical protein
VATEEQQGRTASLVAWVCVCEIRVVTTESQAEGTDEQHGWVDSRAACLCLGSCLGKEGHSHTEKCALPCSHV